MTVLNIQSPAFLGDVVIIWQVFIRMLGYYGTKAARFYLEGKKVGRYEGKQFTVKGLFSNCRSLPSCSDITSSSKTQVVDGTATFPLAPLGEGLRERVYLEGRRRYEGRLFGRRRTGCQEVKLLPVPGTKITSLFSLPSCPPNFCSSDCYPPQPIGEGAKLTYSQNMIRPLTLALSRKGRGKSSSRFTLHTSLKKHAAFTLAEVLITLGIIGVVAAITMPAIISNYQKKQTVSQLKKAYSLLSNVISHSTAINESPLYWDYNDENSFANQYIIPYMKVIKDCGVKHQPIFCYSSVSDEKRMLHRLDGTIIEEGVQYRSFILSNGMGVLMRLGHGSAGAASYIKFYVDVNGESGKTIIGKDVFAFSMRPDWGDKYIFTAGVNGANASGVQNSSYLKDRDYLMSDVRGGCSKTAPSGTGYSQGDFCSLLIQIDGWKISDDYPW